MVNESDQPYRVVRPGEVDSKRIFNVPGVVMLLVVLCVIFFALMVFVPGRTMRIIEFGAAFSPRRFLSGVEANGGVLSMISPLISHMFVHAGLMHLAVNMFFLMAFGAPIARRMGAENALQSFSAFAAASLFATFYFLCGIAGALLYLAFHINEITLLVGASGGISGLFGAVVRFGFSRTSILGPEHGRVSPLFSGPVLLWAFFIVLSNFLFGGAVPGLAGDVNIAWEAHVGGFLFGLVTYPFFERAAQSWR